MTYKHKIIILNNFSFIIMCLVFTCWYFSIFAVIGFACVMFLNFKGKKYTVQKRRILKNDEYDICIGKNTIVYQTKFGAISTTDRYFLEDPKSVEIHLEILKNKFDEELCNLYLEYEVE